MNYQSKESCQNIEDVTDGADGQPRCAVASGSPSVDRLYHLFIRHGAGRMKRLTEYPMTHAECCVMKSKFSDWSQARIVFMEETQ